VQRVVKDGLASAGALAVLVIALVALDSRVHTEIAQRLSLRSPAGIYGMAAEARNLTAVVVHVARDKMADHTPLMLFAVAGTVLVLFMIRT